MLTPGTRGAGVGSGFLCRTRYVRSLPCQREGFCVCPTTSARQVPLFPSLWPLYTAADCRGFCLLPPGTSRLAVLPPPCSPCTLLMLAVKSSAARGLWACMFLSSRCLGSALWARHQLWAGDSSHYMLFSIIGGSCHKHHFSKKAFCRDKIMLAATKLLSRQNIFVATKRLSLQIFVATNTKLLSRQAYFCRDKRCVLFSLDKIIFVATKVLSRQKLYLW